MPNFDFSKEYGVVLEGGGAKGAYQIGVWRAMKECGVKIKGISGVSVGALNGALMCMDDIEKAERIWENISYSQVMMVDDNQMEHLMNGNLRQLDIKQLTKLGIKFLSDRGFDISPLRRLIADCIDEDKLMHSEMELYMGTFMVSNMKEIEVSLSEIKGDGLKDYLLASAYFPAFRNEKLQGKKFMDGGVVNNVPIDILLKHGYQDIIVIRIYGIGIEKRVKIPENVHVIQIAPRVDLGNILQFESKKSKRNMITGYYDGMRCFRNLQGHIYYIQAQYKERECLKRLMNTHEFVQMAFLEYYGLDYKDITKYLRLMMEQVYPFIADELKLTKDWGYQELYLSMLELCAKYVKLPKYKIYTEEALIQNIRSRYVKMKEKNHSFRLPVFVDLVMNLMVTFT